MTENTELQNDVPEINNEEGTTETINESFLDLKTDFKLDVNAVKNHIADKKLDKFIEEDKLNISKLIKSLENAEKLIGKRLDEAEPEMLESVLEKFGIPKSADEYEISGENLDEEKLKEFKELAKEAGIPKSSAQKLFDKLNEKNSDETILKAEKEKIDNNLLKLKEMFGDKYDTKKSYANKVLELFGSDDLKEYIGKSELGTHPEFIQFLSKVGEKFASKNIDSELNAPVKKSEEELRQEVRSLMLNPAYEDASHPEHQKLLARQNEIYTNLYG